MVEKHMEMCFEDLFGISSIALIIEEGHEGSEDDSQAKRVAGIVDVLRRIAVEKGNLLLQDAPPIVAVEKGLGDSGVDVRSAPLAEKLNRGVAEFAKAGVSVFDTRKTGEVKANIRGIATAVHDVGSRDASA